MNLKPISFQINHEEEKLEAMHYEKLKENLTYLQNSLDLSKKENRDLGRQVYKYGINR